MIEDEDEGTPMSDESADIDIKDLELGQQIGSGSYGIVYRGSYFNSDIAIKKIHPGEHQKELQKYLKREVAVLKNIQHPNIVQFIGVYYEPISHVSFLKSNSTWIVTEYISGGNLHERVKNLSKPFPMSLVVKLALDISLAMAYLHSRDIIFRDLKSKNILIDDTNSPIRAKVCDFGFARIVLKTKQNNRHLSLVGTDDFMAPEVILGMEYDESADIYSFGILLLEMAIRKKVSKLAQFERGPQNAFEISEDRVREAIPDNIPPLFIELIIDCIRYEASERPTFSNIIYTLKQLQSLYPIPQSFENPLSPHSSPIIPRKNSINSPFSTFMRLNSFDLSNKTNLNCNNNNNNNSQDITTGYKNHFVNNNSSNNSSGIDENEISNLKKEKIQPINNILIEKDANEIKEDIKHFNHNNNNNNTGSNNNFVQLNVSGSESSSTTTTVDLSSSLTTEDQLDLDEEEVQRKVQYLKDKMLIVLTDLVKFIKILGSDLLSIKAEEEISLKYEDCRKVVELKKTIGEIVEGEIYPVTPRKGSNPPTTRIAIFLKTMERSIYEIKSGLEILTDKIKSEENLIESINYARVISKLKKIVMNTSK